jgi:hypothetical protein
MIRAIANPIGEAACGHGEQNRDCRRCMERLPDRPTRLSMAQEQMVAQSQYLTAAGELQQAFFRAGIDIRLPPLLLRLGQFAIFTARAVLAFPRIAKSGPLPVTKWHCHCAAALIKAWFEKGSPFLQPGTSIAYNDTLGALNAQTVSLWKRHQHTHLGHSRMAASL